MTEPVPGTYPNGVHVVEVEIDPDTGLTRVVKYSAVNDFGTVLNPMLVEGQVQGGAVQGLGQVLLEGAVYDADGQLVTGSFMDYAMPRAHDVPMIEVANRPVPTKTNPVGAKGCGEAGTSGGLPAVANAVIDALSEYGIRHLEMPMTPSRIWQAIQDAKRAKRETLRGNLKNSPVPNLSGIYPLPQSGLYKRAGATSTEVEPHAISATASKSAIKEIPWIASRPLAVISIQRRRNSMQVCAAGGYEAEELLEGSAAAQADLRRVPKAASTRIRRTLAQADGPPFAVADIAGRARYRGPYGRATSRRLVLSPGDEAGRVAIFLCPQPLRARGIVLERQIRQTNRWCQAMRSSIPICDTRKTSTPSFRRVPSALVICRIRRVFAAAAAQAVRRFTCRRRTTFSSMPGISRST